MLNPAALARFTELESSYAPSVVTDHLRQLVEGGRDVDCYKVNAFRVAALLGCERREVVRALLFATRMGIFDLNWDIHCPSCGGLPDYHRHLMKLAHRAHCTLCELDWEIDFTEQVEVTFTVNPDVRVIHYEDFHTRVPPRHLEWFQDITGREQRAFTAVLSCKPNETLSASVVLEAGEYDYELPGRPEGGGLLSVAGEIAHADQAVHLVVDSDGNIDQKKLALAPGVMRISIDFGYPRPWPVRFRRIAPQKNWVSAAYITSQQDFRDLFSGEFLAPDTSFAVRSTTLMFTDIRGSTEMYEELGDAAAYKVVQDHFRLMTEIIRTHEGGIVKTIGDAVMASFPRNLDAVHAACRIQRDFSARASDLRNIEVKIGLHRGPAIAVTSNRSLDFFGRTVNVAARVQGRSKPREILLSPTVLADPAVKQFLDENRLPMETFETQLKGVTEAIQLSSIRPA